MAVPGKKMTKTCSPPPTIIGSDEDRNVYCQPCDRDGPRLPAHGYCADCREHLCETCIAAHKRHTLSRFHSLLDKNSMPQTMSQASVYPSQPDNLTKPCPKHKNEMIKFYCQNHEALLCGVCVTLEHTGTSCKVNYIPDLSDQIINSKELEDILKIINKIAENCKKKSKDMKEITTKSNESLTHLLADIKQFRKEINQILDKVEKQAEDEAKKFQHENNKNLKTVVTTCDNVKKSMKVSSDIIKHLNTSKQADKLFTELKIAEQRIKGYEKYVRQPPLYDFKEYKFIPNEQISTLLDKEISLGTFTEELLKQPNNPPAVYVTTRQTERQRELNVNTSKDKDRCWITGMTLLTPDLLIITDWGNRAVKMVDTCRRYVIHHLQLDTWPRDITAVNSTDVAVTLPDKKNIQFISVLANKLWIKQTLKADGKCHGISYCQGRLVLSFFDPAKLQIIDINGTILTTVRGKNMFSQPYHVTTCIDSIYVSDMEMKTITWLNWQGEVISSFGGMTEPYGITVSDAGTVFVCDRSRHVIEEIAGDCSTGKDVVNMLQHIKGRVMLRDVCRPYAVCWCAETSKLYFSSHTYIDTDKVLCWCAETSKLYFSSHTYIDTDKVLEVFKLS